MLRWFAGRGRLRPGAAVVFDMDGTLLRPDSVLQRLHMAGLAAAIEHETGITAEFEHIGAELRVSGHSLSGFTDAGTIDLVLRLGGVGPEHANRLRARVVARMSLEVSAAMAGRRDADDLLPGAAELLGTLSSEGVFIGLATGNAHRIAAAKIAALGLGATAGPGARYGGLYGGFGDDEPDRARVAGYAAAAMRRVASAERVGLAMSSILLVGDTPSDVRAARSAGIRCLAVATGATPLEELSAVGPDAAVPNLLAVNAWALAAALRARGPLDAARTKAPTESNAKAVVP